MVRFSDTFLLILFLYNTFQAAKITQRTVDILGVRTQFFHKLVWHHLKPTLYILFYLHLITGESLISDLVLVFNNDTVYLLDLTAGFDWNVRINNDRKSAKYCQFIIGLQSNIPMLKLWTFLWELLVSLEYPLNLLYLCLVISILIIKLIISNYENRKHCHVMHILKFFFKYSTGNWNSQVSGKWSHCYWGNK